MKSRTVLRTLFLIVFLLLLVGTLILMLVIPPIEDAHKREELGDPLAFVTSTARTPWAYATEEGNLSVRAEDCVGLTVLRVPEVVNGVTVTGVSAVFSSALTGVERVILPSTVPEPTIDRSLASWTSLCEIVFREGCTSLNKASLKAEEQIEAIYLPASLEKLGWNFLREGNGSPTIYYAGTKEDFQLLGGDAARLEQKYTVVFETAAPTEWLESTK